MCNDRTTAQSSLGDPLRRLFGPHPGWYEAYWYPPPRAKRAHRRSPLAFPVAVLTAAMALPAEIRRVTTPCRTGGE